MQAHTRKHPTDSGLIQLHFKVHPVNVERIKRYVESVEPVDEEGSITADEFFEKYFPGESKPGVCLRSARTATAYIRDGTRKADHRQGAGQDSGEGPRR
jgi:hypothetical protein